MDEKNAYAQSDVMGEVRLADEVVAYIAGIAASEVKGVAGVALNGKKIASKTYGRAIRVEMCDKMVSIDLSVIVEYGVSLQKIGEDIQERVRVSVENMTGLEISDVNVRIEGIDVAAYRA